MLKKDLDIMDFRIRSLDVSVRLRLDEIRKLDDRLENLRNEEHLMAQIKTEVYNRGDTFLELTVSELIKSVEFRVKRLIEEITYARDWEHTKRDADTLRSEITALMKQAAICKVSELSSRAAKQLQKIDLIMRATADPVKMPKIYKVSERSNSDQRLVKKQKPSQPQGAYKSAFLTSSTPISAFSSNHKQENIRTRKRVGLSRNHSYRRPVLENHSDDTKLQYVDTVELDLSRLTPSSPRHKGDQSDRLTLKSVSTSTIPALSE